MTAHKAIQAVKAEIEKMGLNVPVYLYEKPTDEDGEYITVNHLAYEYNQGVDSFYVNVNFHAKDNRLGDIRTARLVEVSGKIAERFIEPVYLEEIYFSTSSVSSPEQDTDATHYMNIRLEAIYSLYI